MIRFLYLLFVIIITAGSCFASVLTFDDIYNIDVDVDYLVVTPEYFRQYAQDLCDYRTRVGNINSPRFVTTESIYENFLELFSETENPKALSIRHAIREISQNVENLKYVVLFGSGYMENQERERENFIPAIYDYSNAAVNRLRISDDLYVSDTINITHLYPISISIGRISVRNYEQAQNYLNKLAAYEDIKNSGLWKNRILFVADDDLNGHTDPDQLFHEGYLSSLIYPKIPNYVDKRKVYIGAYTNDANGEHSTVSQDIQSALNSGANFFVYSGHAWSGGLSTYNVLADWNVDRYVTNDKLTIMLALGCLIGDFNTTVVDISLVEKMTFELETGTVAALGTTNLLSADANNTFGGEFFRAVYENSQDNKYLGDLVRKAKNIYNNNSRLSSYILFGCPATKVSTPRYMDSIIAQIDTLKGNIDNEIVLQTPYNSHWEYDVEFYDVDDHFSYSRQVEPFSYSYTNMGDILYSNQGVISSGQTIYLPIGDIGDDAYGSSAGVYLRNGLYEVVSYTHNIYRFSNNIDETSVYGSSFYNLKNANFDVNLGPNPIKDELNATVYNNDNSLIGENLQISLYSMNGKLIFRDVVGIKSLGVTETFFRINNLNQGVFVVVFNVKGYKPQKHFFTKVE